MSTNPVNESLSIAINKVINCYTEMRRAQYISLLAACNVEGILQETKYNLTLSDVTHTLEIRPEHKVSFGWLILSLIRFGALKCHGGGTKLKLVEDFSYSPVNWTLVEMAAGPARTRTLKHGNGFTADVQMILNRTSRKSETDFGESEISRWRSSFDQPYYSYLRKRCVQLTAKTGATVLDLGCGVGDGVSELLDQVGPSGKIIGIDSSASFVDYARSRFADFNNVSFFSIDASATDILVKASSIDLVFVFAAFQFIPDGQQALANIAKVLKLGGLCQIGFALVPSSSFDYELLAFKHSLRKRPVELRDLSNILRLAYQSGLEPEENPAFLGSLTFLRLRKVSERLL